MTLTEKVAYLKGLAAGLDLDKESKEAKIFEAIFDILDDMSLTVTAVDEDLADLEDYVEEIDEDLADVEAVVYDDDDCCDCCDCEDDDELYEVECPSCGEEILLDDDMLDEEFIECPNCGEKLELDIELDDCCDCDCCDCEDEE